MSHVHYVYIILFIGLLSYYVFRVTFYELLMTCPRLLISRPLSASPPPHPHRLRGPASMDVALLIFVLSAINPDKMVHALQNLASVMKPGGLVLFRDYGIYDMVILLRGLGFRV
jgi:hypothetical protein